MTLRVQCGGLQPDSHPSAHNTLTVESLLFLPRHPHLFPTIPQPALPDDVSLCQAASMPALANILGCGWGATLIWCFQGDQFQFSVTLASPLLTFGNRKQEGAGTYCTAMTPQPLESSPGFLYKAFSK